MANASFYGGRQGFNFIIVKSYPSVSEMVDKFSKGPDYTTVHFDEYVLINTVNKKNPENGKVYRRGYNYTDPIGGAIYIGTIVGPSGPAPTLEFTTIDNVKTKPDWKEGSYGHVDNNLIPGKDSNGNYHDTIDWAYCSISDINSENTTAYIGFKFPYTVIDFTAETVSPYDSAIAEQVFDDPNIVHPFYEKWNIKIPHGVHGSSLENLRVIDAASENIEPYLGQQDDIDNHRKIVVYTYYNYDNNVTGDPINVYLGDYNVIDDIRFDNNGTIIIDYSHDNDLVKDRYIKWIENVTLDKTNGHFKVIYNQTDNSGNKIFYETYLKWVSDLSLNADGTISLKYIDNTTTTLTNKIKWITNITFDPTNGTITVYYNDGTNKPFTNALKSITNVGFNDTTNKIEISFNDGTKQTINKVIKFIDNIYLNDESSNKTVKDHKFHVVYNTGDDEPVGETINFIKRTIINPVNYHLLVYYSSPEYRQELINKGAAVSFDNLDGWLDLGSLKDDSGILVGFNVYSTMTITAAIAYLNNNYPNGLTDLKNYGKIVTVGALTDNKRFYAFDYDANTWFYLGTFDNQYDWTLVCKENDLNIITYKNRIAIGGTWFILE